MSDHLTFLYIGQLFKGSTCESRRRMLERLGHATVSFDLSPYTGYHNRILRSIAHRTNAGPPVSAFNRDLLDFAARTRKRIDYIWVDKGKWLQPETILELKQITGAPVIHYTPDAQLLDNGSRQFSASIPLYDILFTTKPFELHDYRRLGSRAVFLVHQGYDSDRLYPRILFEEHHELASDICFIGHCQPHYAESLLAARRSGGQLRVWGPGWSGYAHRHAWAREIVGGEGLWGHDYAGALVATSIGLCLLSKRIPETTTTRTFEIPGCGTFMLAERTEHHQQLFQEGVEAEFFGNHDELAEKIRFYLHHESLRQRIAAAGYRRCVNGGYSDFHRMQQMIDTATRTCGKFKTETSLPAPLLASVINS